METGIYDLNITQHSTYSKVFTCTDKDDIVIDLTDYTADLIIKSSLASTTPILSLSETDGLTLGADGTITVAIAATSTATLTLDKMWYYLELTTGATVTRPLQGDVYLSKR